MDMDSGIDCAWKASPHRPLLASQISRPKQVASCSSRGLVQNCLQRLRSDGELQGVRKTVPQVGVPIVSIPCVRNYLQRRLHVYTPKILHSFPMKANCWIGPYMNKGQEP